MKLKRPKLEVRRVHVTARDAVTGKSRTITVYETSPDEVIDRVGRAMAAEVAATAIGGCKAGSAAAG